MSNTQTLQQSSASDRAQVLSATGEERQKMAQSGLGNTGASVFTTLNTDQANQAMLNQIQRTASTNQQNIHNIDLYDNSMQLQIESRISNMLKNAYATGQLGQDGSTYNFGGQQFSGDDLNKILQNINQSTGQNLSGEPPAGNIDFNKKAGAASGKPIKPYDYNDKAGSNSGNY